MNTVNDNYDKLLKVADVMVQDEVTNEEIENVAETIQELHEEEPMEDYIPTEEDLELEKEPQKLNVLIDSTGKINNVLANDIKYSSDNLEQLMALSPEEIKSKVPINREHVEESIKTILPVSKIEDLDIFMKALERYRRDEKFSYYNALPKSMQNAINTMIGTSGAGYASTKEVRNYVAQGLFDQVINDNYTNAMFDDLQTSIDNSYKELYESTKGEFSKYNNNQRHVMEERLPKMADEIESEDPEKAAILREASRMFIQAYTYEDMYNMYTTTGKLKVKQIEIDKIERSCRVWNAKYEGSKFVINDLREAISTLKDQFEFDDRIIKHFLGVFMKFTQNMKPEYIPEHIFMYYFIKNIISLKYYNHDDEEECKFYEDLKGNIYKFLTAIVEKEKARIENGKKGNNRK